MPDFGIFRGFNDKLFGDKLYAGQLPINLGMVKTDFFVGLLDDYPNAAAAYSLRKLRTAYTGSAIEVRRTNNDVADIGFTSTGELDTAALLAFTGTGALDNGFVTKWYDQSGNARNATQVTALSQPQIVSAGSVILLNGKPSINFDGIDDKLICSFGLLSQPNTIFSVAKSDLTPGLKLLYDDDSGNDRNTYDTIGDAFAGAPVMKSTAWIDNIQYLHSILYNGSNSFIYRNSNLISTTSSIGTQGLSGLTIGARFSGNFWDGDIQEFILYNLNQSTNRIGIEDNTNDFYLIF
jgi:hypothetical protein